MTSTRAPLRRSLAVLAALCAALVGLLATTLTSAAPARAASLQEVTSFGSNPGGLRMFLFVPDTLPARPAVLVVNHYCTGSAQAMYSGSHFDELATRYGYIVVYPSTNRSGSCFDVSSSEALKHGGASDPTSIVSMVRYVQQRWTTDTSRVFATGVSSGAMMTQVLLATYPDVFAAGSAFAGVPATCFSTSGPPPGTTSQAGWNSDCAQGRLTRTAQQWGDLARAAYPGYTGPRPRVQLWHGTQDDTLSYVQHGEAIKQWTNVLGVSATPSSTETIGNNTRTRYGGTGDRAPVEANSLSGVGHNLPVDAAGAIRFFGLDQATTPTPTTPAPTTPLPTPTATTPTPPVPTDWPTLPQPTATSGPATCTVAWSVNQWNTGFTANVTITNLDHAPASGWQLTWRWTAGQKVTQAWSSTVTQTGDAVVANNAAWNANIPVGGSVQIGFNATHTGSNPPPADLKLNGRACARA
ncbi:extracellular catalytic domain type 1 short-chain-length polyhydroxyalkanoate depolymerase [Cellulomonas septica]|uniref:PHB depolymerase family esterase n=1 Tax=Cellulomonas septica TaxID=285080 RepID=A0ABX1K2S8_9CELL|nr:PHB depolymerase family esterase [Cellulomonas septica]NKY39942.1 PHB depolymerase family esterase [Cellulomonas septica]